MTEDDAGKIITSHKVGETKDPATAKLIEAAWLIWGKYLAAKTSIRCLLVARDGVADELRRIRDAEKQGRSKIV
jgi:hypothetical protein